MGQWLDAMSQVTFYPRRPMAANQFRWRWVLVSAGEQSMDKAEQALKTDSESRSERQGGKYGHDTLRAKKKSSICQEKRP